MILRSIALRHGRRAVAKPPVLAWRRCLATHLDQPASAPLHDRQPVQGAVDASDFDEPSALASRQQQEPEDQVARDYHAFQRQKELTHNIGSTIAPHYQPHTLLTNPPSPQDISLELLLASQSHLGHSTSLWNPANARYIYGIRQGVHIISLDQTASHLRRACAIVRAVTERGGLVLFVGTRDGHERAVVKAAQMAGGCHLFDRWIPGSITNGPQILGRCGVKVVDENDNEVKGFEEQLQDRGALKPDLVVCLNPLENYVLLHECGLNNIPTIGVIDTDANPTWVTYPIPANDDSLRCIQVIAGVLGRAGQEGQTSRLAQASTGRVTYKPRHGLKVPINASSSRATNAEPTRGIDEEIAQARRDERTVTSATDAVDDPVVEADLNARLISAFEYAKFANFDPEATRAAFEMFIEDEATATPQFTELTNQLRNSRMAAGLPAEPEELVHSERLDRQTGAELESEVQEMLDEPLTDEEAAALHAQAGGKGANVYRGGSYRSALKRQGDSADPTLRRMIALKRSAFGEELSAEDQEELKKVAEEEKSAASIPEGPYAIPRATQDIP
ncbi:hypothetical protein MBLNU459_g6733t1 [Dothideomycetes sp. NU459]